ncbi:MAG: sulfotransferase [Pseudomonadota bacterium]
MQPHYAVLLKDLLHTTIGAAASVALPPVKRFIILSSGRSGSNLLSSFMKSHPKVFQHGEIFGEFQLESPLVRRRINGAGLARYLDRRLSRMTTEDAAGIKILYHNLEAQYGKARGIPGTEMLMDHMRDSPTLRIVHLRREDKLAMLISMRLATELGQWVSGSYGDTTVTLPVDWVRDQFTWLEGWETRIAAHFPSDQLLDMSYEQLVADTPGEMARVFEFLSLEAAPVSSRMSKQNKRSKAEAVENYAELCEAFAGTPYAPMFET